MSDPAEVVRKSPVDYPTAVGYALHRTMRWLLITYVVGAILLSFGLGLLASPSGPLPVNDVAGLVLAVGGATLLFGGGIGVLFKVIVDGVTLANGLTDADSRE